MYSEQDACGDECGWALCVMKGGLDAHVLGRAVMSPDISCFRRELFHPASSTRFLFELIACEVLLYSPLTPVPPPDCAQT